MFLGNLGQPAESAECNDIRTCILCNYYWGEGGGGGVNNHDQLNSFKNHDHTIFCSGFLLQTKVHTCRYSVRASRHV